MTACSRLVMRYGMTASISGPMFLPLSCQMRAFLAFPFGVTALESLPPASSLHRSTIRQSVDDTDMHASQLSYPYRLECRTMNEPSPSSIPANQADSVGVMRHQFYRINSVTPLFPNEVSA